MARRLVCPLDRGTNRHWCLSELPFCLHRRWLVSRHSEAISRDLSMPCHSPDLGPKVVEKRVKPLLSSKADKEIAVLLRAGTHPNIIAFLGRRDDGDSVILILEPMSHSVRQALNHHRRPFDELHVQRFTADVLRAVIHLFHLGILHRDLKGDNILLNEEETIAKLCDFGDASDLVPIQDRHGTVAFMAPEAVFGPHEVQSEVWALACCTLEMASGLFPWSEHGLEKDPLSFFIRRSNQLPLIPEAVSHGARCFIEDCLKREPAERPALETLALHGFVSSLM
eukprot:m.329144 g.329144  ORF g.329144 m.329144 type:complete len:282 (-) comp55596_c0_seq46:20-865(-)